jgi:hypothetical protein
LPVDCSWFFVFGSTGATNFDSLIPFKHYQPYMCTPSVLYCIHFDPFQRLSTIHVHTPMSFTVSTSAVLCALICFVWIFLTKFSET